MRRQRNEMGQGWKSRLSYLAGIAVLTFTVFLALFLPELYTRWQDERTLEEVSLSQRDEIQFLDTDALDISVRLKMLSESDSFLWFQGNTYFPEDSVQWEDSGEPLLEQCRAGVKTWSACNLMPEGLEELVHTEDGAVAAYYYVQIDGGVIPVAVLCFPADPDGQFLEAVVDADNGFLYYACSVGGRMDSYLWNCLGTDGFDEMEEAMETGTYGLTQIRPGSDYQFAEPAGADGQEILSSDFSGMFLDMQLHFEDFDSVAYRGMFEYYPVADDSSIASGTIYPGSTGLAVMFGSQDWKYLAAEVASYYYGVGLEDYSMDAWIMEWNDFVLQYDRDDLLQESMGTEQMTEVALVIEKEQVK